VGDARPWAAFATWAALLAQGGVVVLVDERWSTDAGLTAATTTNELEFELLL
jgi:hypothetical protein